MDTVYFLCFVPSLVFLLVFIYFTMVRKNEFEERLALYRPQHHSLPFCCIGFSPMC